MSNDSSAFDTGPGRADSTAGERALDSRIAEARWQMWRHWGEYTDWSRKLDQLERERDDWYRSIYDRTPAAISQDDKAPERR